MSGTRVVTFPDGGIYVVNIFKAEHESATLIGKFNAYYYGSRNKVNRAPIIGWWRYDTPNNDSLKRPFKEGDLINKVFENDARGSKSDDLGHAAASRI